MTDCRCNICGGQLKPRLEGVVDPQSGDRFGIGVCELCGLGHTLPPPAELATYYGAEYYGNRHGLTDRYCTRRRARFLTAGAGPGRETRSQLIRPGGPDWPQHAHRRLGPRLATWIVGSWLLPGEFDAQVRSDASRLYELDPRAPRGLCNATRRSRLPAPANTAEFGREPGNGLRGRRGSPTVAPDQGNACAGTAPHAIRAPLTASESVADA